MVAPPSRLGRILGSFTAWAGELRAPTTISVSESEEYGNACLHLHVGQERLGEFWTTTGATIPRLWPKGQDRATPSLLLQSAHTDEPLDANGLKPNEKFSGLGTGGMAAISELSFLKGRHGHVILEADASKRRHPAPFYFKTGFRPAYPIGDARNVEVENLLQRATTPKSVGWLNPWTTGSQEAAAARQPEPFQWPHNINMEIKEGMGKTALAARAAQIAKAKEQPEGGIKDPDALLKLAPAGTKAHRIAEIKAGRAVLDETQRRYANGSLILD